MKHFQYVLLFVLGISFLSVDYKLDALDLREGEYDFTVQVYSDYLDRQIASSENWFLKYSMKYSPIKEGIFDAQFGVIEFFNRMRFNNKINLHQRLMDVIEVLNPRFYAPKSIYGFNEIGVSILDAKQLYIKYLNPLNYGMCNYQCNIYNLHSVYDERSELFI